MQIESGRRINLIKDQNISAREEPSPEWSKISANKLDQPSIYWISFAWHPWMMISLISVTFSVLPPEGERWTTKKESWRCLLRDKHEDWWRRYQIKSPPISILHRLFRCTNSNFWDIVASSRFLPTPYPPPSERPPRACSRANAEMSVRFNKRDVTPGLRNKRKNWVTLWSKYFATFFFVKVRTSGWPWNEGWERGSYYQGFILSQGEGCGEEGEWQQTRQRYDKSPIWARILRDRNIFYIMRAGRTKAGSNAPGAFLVNRLSPGN